MKKIIRLLIFISPIPIIIIILTINQYILRTTKPKIKKIEEIDIQEMDCILVLGAGIRNNNPSPMLEDRLLTTVELYNNNISSKIVVSGDHGQENYDEVNVMKNYLLKKGIPSDDIFMDHAGFSTYESIYRLKEIFKTQKIIIVTQEYHLYRALHIASKLNIESYGVIANRREYQNQFKREIREILARIKDFIKCIFKPKPKYLGEIIPVSGKGNITNDK